MEFTAKDVEEALKALFYEDEAEHYELEEANGIDLGALGKTEYVESFGGEGQGDTRWIVFKVQDRLFRISGYYSSWDGTEWDDDVEEVEEVEVVKKEYKRKK